MLLDQISLLTAIGFSSAALTLTLLASWLGARTDNYLLSWAAGMALVVLGVVVFSIVGAHYDPGLQLASFALLLAGFALVYAGTRQFRLGAVPWLIVVGLWAVFAGGISVAFALGLSGLGTAGANFGIAVFLILAAHECWSGRAEAPVPLVANAVLYLIVAVSFVLCGLELLREGRLVLTARPQNWAEDFNSIAAIIGLTGIGALSITLNQFRAARHHRQQSMTDPLTGMLNRRALFDNLAGKAIEPGVAVIMFDLDHFKAINDRLGHAIGDLVLQQFATIVLDNVRAADTAARLGGEEFCIVLGRLSSRTAVGVAERIRETFETTLTPSMSEPVRATVSAGIAISGSKGETFEHLLGRADSALYKAKRDGRNRVHAPGLRLVA
ncbi:diguanylate cyclase (GGDEF)-like protein [Devosia sp. UYZn731]|uniref:GGDEF domain-containing protein n=1 Tax=Devosia sp. UYZn731 TaxID=3156345 RepID=UPI0033924762